MSARSRQRETRREALRQRCADQREQLAESLGAVARHLEPIEKTVTALRAMRRTPVLLGVIGALAALGAMLFSRRARRPRVSPWSWLPLAAPLLKLLELWWQHRAAATARPVSEVPDPPCS